MSFSDFFSNQARKPSGIFGRFFMSHIFEKGNAELNDFVKEMLSIQENDHALEIGFGTGNLIKEMAGNLQNGIIEGIDFSKTMVDVAQRKNKKYIDKGKVKIRLGDFNDVPFDDDCFDKIYSVNTIYFWKNPEAGIARIHDILKPGGKLVLGFHDKEQMDKMSLNEDVFRYYSTRDVADLLSNDGLLNNVDIISRKGKQNALHCAVGIK